MSLVDAAVASLTLVFALFGTICYMAYGNDTKQVVTENLAPGAVSSILVKFLFSLNLVFTYPIVVTAANRIIESWLRLVKNSELNLGVQSRQRYWL